MYSWDAKNYRWETSGDNSGVGFDAALLPRLRFPMGDAEIYGALPVGLTVASKDDNRIGGEVEYGLGFGYSLGIFGGAQFSLTRELGIFGELGLQIRKISNSGQAKPSGADGDIIYRSSQLCANFGVAFL